VRRDGRRNEGFKKGVKREATGLRYGRKNTSYASCLKPQAFWLKPHVCLEKPQ